MTMDNFHALESLLVFDEPYNIIAYHAYPTGHLQSNEVFSAGKDGPSAEDAGDQEMNDKFIQITSKIHSEALQMVSGQDNPRIDNKSAVEIRVDGAEQSMFLLNYDSVCYAVSAVENRGGAVHRFDSTPV